MSIGVEIQNAEKGQTAPNCPEMHKKRFVSTKNSGLLHQVVHKCNEIERSEQVNVMRSNEENSIYLKSNVPHCGYLCRFCFYVGAFKSIRYFHSIF